LSFLMLLCSVSVSAFAVSETSGEITVDMGYTEAVRFDPRTTVPQAVDNSGTANRFFADTADTPYTFYSMLTVRQKDVYNGLLNAGLGSADNVNGVKITFTSPITCQNTTKSLTAEAQNEISLAAVGGISALMDDHPEMFWLGGYSLSYSYSYSVSGGIYSFSVPGITCKMAYDTATYADKAAVTDYYNRMMAAVDAFKVNGDTRYEKLKSIHDQIVKSVQYDSTFTCPTAHDPTSVFLEPYTPVCEGYAEALKILCNRENIPCVIVVGDANGGGHAWNYVKMEDNKWYAVDMTWDDPVGNSTDGVFYDYFLVGSQATNRYFGNDATTFENDHTPTGQRFSTTLFSLTYPTLNTTSYSPMLINRNSGATVKKTEKLVFIEKDGVFSTSFVAPYGYSIATSGLTTGGTLTVKKASTVTDTYTLVRRGDVNASNTVTSADTDILREAANANYKFQSGTANYYAADMNGDGAVDAYDAIAHDLYVNDMLKYN
ncbi:MAG: transglutaminase domain-containing protein, partial [Candidatus Fimenecus sp.]